MWHRIPWSFGQSVSNSSGIVAQLVSLDTSFSQQVRYGSIENGQSTSMETSRRNAIK